MSGRRTDLATLRAVVAAWAAAEPLVTKVWLFGSRVKGAERPDSDLDIAIVNRRLPGDSGPWVTFIGESGQMRAKLEALLSVPVDLQWYGGPEATPRIHSFLAERSILIYEDPTDYGDLPLVRTKP